MEDEMAEAEIEVKLDLLDLLVRVARHDPAAGGALDHCPRDRRWHVRSSVRRGPRNRARSPRSDPRGGPGLAPDPTDRGARVPAARARLTKQPRKDGGRSALVCAATIPFQPSLSCGGVAKTDVSRVLRPPIPPNIGKQHHVPGERIDCPTVDLKPRVLRVVFGATGGPSPALRSAHDDKIGHQGTSDRMAVAEPLDADLRC